MLEQVCLNLHNWFEKDIISGEFDIKDRALQLDIPDGQYFRIVGSIFNDGLHQAPAQLTDEMFKGEVWLLAIPQAVIELADEIQTWSEKYQTNAPYKSESFDGYSYSLAGSTDVITWQDVFRKRLNVWRKLC
jgi:hypothetical protein